jgi:hypothetical protein
VDIPQDVQSLASALSGGGVPLIPQPLISQFIIEMRKIDNAHTKSNKPVSNLLANPLLPDGSGGSD